MPRKGNWIPTKKKNQRQKNFLTSFKACQSACKVEHLLKASVLLKDREANQVLSLAGF
jgi:hypothetical protein